MDSTFTLLPLHLDPATKVISSTDPTIPSLDTELNALNATHRTLLALDASHAVPPPPLPLNPKRSAAIQKMREQGNASLAKRATGGSGPQQQQQHMQEAIKLYSYAIDMALKRPPWEPASIVRDELAILMSNRSQAHIGLQAWPEGATDAETSVEMKAAPGQGKAWWRRGRCLLEMGRLDEAAEWVDKALEVESGAGEGGADLKALKVEVDARMKKQKDRARKKA